MLTFTSRDSFLRHNRRGGKPPFVNGAWPTKLLLICSLILSCMTIGSNGDQVTSPRILSAVAGVTTTESNTNKPSSSVARKRNIIRRPSRVFRKPTLQPTRRGKYHMKYHPPNNSFKSPTTPGNKQNAASSPTSIPTMPPSSTPLINTFVDGPPMVPTLSPSAGKATLAPSPSAFVVDDPDLLATLSPTTVSK